MNAITDNGSLGGKNICRDKLIIFDYSGTLSLEMARFARLDNLLQQLKESGLFALGVDSAALFWDIVNATWTEGSTTGQGYKKTMQKRISELFSETADSRCPEVLRAVSNFVDAYLAHSQIDEHWRPILKTVSSDKSAQVVIATDHYAEATDAIIRQLARWGLKATALSGNSPGGIIVANSADMGVHKDEPQFWRIVRDTFHQKYGRILLIDDFGHNEQQGDDYSNVNKAGKRQKMTIKMLREVFAAQVESIPFTIKEGRAAKQLIAEASAIIEQVLCGKSRLK
jgi:hypothetical protein